MEIDDINRRLLREEAGKISSGNYSKELKVNAKGIVNGGLVFGGIGILYAMLTNKNTFILGIAGFLAGVVMVSIYKKIEKMSVTP